MPTMTTRWDFIRNFACGSRCTTKTKQQVHDCFPCAVVGRSFWRASDRAVPLAVSTVSCSILARFVQQRCSCTSRGLCANCYRCHRTHAASSQHTVSSVPFLGCADCSTGPQQRPHHTGLRINGPDKASGTAGGGPGRRHRGLASDLQRFHEPRAAGAGRP